MPNKKFQSRGPEINTDLCVEKVENRFDLVLIASTRAREIKRHNIDSFKREHVFPIITALKDIESGEIGREYLNKVK